MNERIIVKEAVSLEEARKALYGDDDLIVIGESILSPGRLETIDGIADSVENAIRQLRTRVPAEAEIETQEIKTAPSRVVLKVKGKSEESAVKELGLKKHELIESVSLHRKARKGFLGFFKAPAVYEVAIFQQAIVEIRFREKARLQAKVQDYLAKDLLQSIHEVRERNADWAEVLQWLNPKKDPHIQTFLEGLRASDLIDLQTALNIIESECRKNEKTNWKTAITDAQKEASHLQVQLWVESRSLDAKLASVFMFYTSVDWNPKGHKEPSGIPMHVRSSYGRHYPGRQFEQTIPRYSTNKEAFNELKRRAVEFGVYDISTRILGEEGLDQDIATLRQKCEAILKAKKDGLAQP